MTSIIEIQSLISEMKQEADRYHLPIMRLLLHIAQETHNYVCTAITL